MCILPSLRQLRNVCTHTALILCESVAELQHFVTVGAWTNTILLRRYALSPASPGVEGEVIIQKVLGKPFTVGYNAMADRVTDLLDEGVIDPAKVTRNGLMNACSIAGIMLTTQAVMVEKQRPEGAPGGMSGGMPAGMAV